MKIKNLTFCSFVVLFLVSSFPVFGVETTRTDAVKKPVVTPRPQQKEIKKEVIQVKKTATQEIKVARQETKAETKNTSLLIKRKQISNSIIKIRVEIVRRYGRIAADKTKLQNRINERKAKGLDTSAAETRLATFSTASYLNHLSSFDSQTALAVASTRPYTQNSDLKATAKLLNTDLINLQKILNETVRDLVSVKDKKTPTNKIK